MKPKSITVSNGNEIVFLGDANDEQGSANTCVIVYDCIRRIHSFK